jgi:hypothetical protein
MSILSKYKEEFVTLLVIIACLTVYKLIPTKGTFQLLFSMSVFFVIVPLLYNKYILKRKISEIGLSLGNWKQGIVFSLISLVTISLIVLLASRYTLFIKSYPIPEEIKGNFSVFLFYQLIFIPFFIAINEIFFRGFVLFRYETAFKYWAILFQLLIYVSFLLIIKGNNWLYITFALFTPFAGFIALKSRSILYSFAFQVIAFLIIDVCVLVLK